MKPYLQLLEQLLHSGIKKKDRTSTGTLSISGHMMRFNLAEGFPLLTTKRVHLKSIIHELLWFLQGITNVKYLQEHGVKIWDEWADENGELGPIYGYQWRSWPTPEGGHIDQIAESVKQIQNNPWSRRHLVVAWNPADVPKMALPPCHLLFQFIVRPNTNNPSTPVFLDCLLYQQSCDTFLGVPFNIASYALLTMMFASVCNLLPGEFIWVGGDVHLYLNHLEQARLQLSREPRALPQMRISPWVKSLLDFQHEDFTLECYNPHPTIRAPISV